jgi:hypothetical protein
MLEDSAVCSRALFALVLNSGTGTDDGPVSGAGFASSVVFRDAEFRLTGEQHLQESSGGLHFSCCPDQYDHRIGSLENRLSRQGGDKGCSLESNYRQNGSLPTKLGGLH